MRGSVEAVYKKTPKRDKFKWPHYYDNNLIFKVTKEAASILTTWDLGAPPPLAAIWTVLIVFYANHSQDPSGTCGSAVAIMSPTVGWLMKETLARKTRRQEGNTVEVNTIIDFIQMKSVVLYSQSDACLQSVDSFIYFPRCRHSVGNMSF